MLIYRPLLTLIALVSLCLLPATAEDQSRSSQKQKLPKADPAAVRTAIPARVEIVADGLDFPSSVELDDRGNIWIGLSGAGHGNPSAKPAVLKVGNDGKTDKIIEDGLVSPLNDLLWHNDSLYISHRGKVSKWDGSTLNDVVSGLPSHGDHTNNQIDIGPDGKLYIGQGSATNSAVVGPDNKAWVMKHPDFHDMLPKDVLLTGRTFTSQSFVDSSNKQAKTSAFFPFAEIRTGKASSANKLPVPSSLAPPRAARIAGRGWGEGKSKSVTYLRTRPKEIADAVEVPNACLLRCELDGSNLEVFAWGLRNPFGVLVNDDGTVFVGDHGCDVRGSRPIKDDLEDLYLLKQGDWAGWPDYCYGVPVTDKRFKPDGKTQPKFVMAEHPEVAVPVATFPSHSAIGKLDRLNEDSPLGSKGDVFIALFGNMAPKTGTAPNPPGGMRVMKYSPSTKEMVVFAEAEEPKPTDWTAGIRRPLDVRITQDAKSLFIADYGTLGEGKHLKAVKNSGVVWKITAE